MCIEHSKVNMSHGKVRQEIALTSAILLLKAFLSDDYFIFSPLPTSLHSSPHKIIKSSTVSNFHHCTTIGDLSE
jgi:hypothetical protein